MTKETGKEFEIPGQVEPLHYKGEQLQNKLSRLSEKRREIIRAAENPFVESLLLEHLYHRPQDRHIAHLLNPEYQPSYIKGGKKVFFDIETTHLPNDNEITVQYPTGSTNYIAKQRLGVAVSISDQGDVVVWSEDNISDFIIYLLSFDEVVTFNGLRFDNYVLSNYSDPEQTQQLFNKSFDLYPYLEMRYRKRKPLKHWRDKLLKEDNKAKKKIHDSSNIPEMLREGTDFEKKLARYACFQDALAVMKIFKSEDIDADKKTQLYEWQLDQLNLTMKELVNSHLKQEVSDLDFISYSTEGVIRESASEIVQIDVSRWKDEEIRALISPIYKRFYQETDRLIDELEEYAQHNHQEAIGYLLNNIPNYNAVITPSILGPETDEADEPIYFFPNLRDTRILNKKIFSRRPFDSLSQASELSTVLPDTFLTETDFLERTYRPVIDDSFVIRGKYGTLTSTAIPNIHNSWQEFIAKNNLVAFRDSSGKVVVLIDRITKPMLTDDYYGDYKKVLSVTDEIYCNSMTEKAADYFQTEKNSTRVNQPFSLESLVENDVVSPKEWPSGEEFLSFLTSNFIPQILALTRRYQAAIAEAVKPAVLEHLTRCEEVFVQLRGVHGIENDPTYESLRRDILLSKCILAYLEKGSNNADVDEEKMMLETKVLEEIKDEVAMYSSIG